MELRLTPTLDDYLRNVTSVFWYIGDDPCEHEKVAQAFIESAIAFYREKGFSTNFFEAEIQNEKLIDCIPFVHVNVLLQFHPACRNFFAACGGVVRENGELDLLSMDAPTFSHEKFVGECDECIAGPLHVPHFILATNAISTDDPLDVDLAEFNRRIIDIRTTYKIPNFEELEELEELEEC